MLSVRVKQAQYNGRGLLGNWQCVWLVENTVTPITMHGRVLVN